MMCAKFERKIKQSKHVKIKNIGFIYFISPVFQVALVIYMNSQIAFIHHIDALLPQTQCGLCGHPDGCLPYAKAISEGELANKCVPGGQPVADALALLLNRPLLVAEESVWPIQLDGRPQRMKAIIREDECIGCTKCISACPVDAIIGSAKLMHTILTDLCTGCELCIPPCPVDCIDLIADNNPLPTAESRRIEHDDLRHRYYAHIQREENRRSIRKGPTVRADIDSALFTEFFAQNHQVESVISTSSETKPVAMLDAKSTIELAKIRTQIKKLEKQLSVREDAKKRLLLDDLTHQLNQLQEA